MRKIAVSFLLIALASSSAFAAPALPFVGTKTFNFMGGGGTGESITIRRNGTAKIMIHGASGSYVEYSGRFSYSGMKNKDYPNLGWLFRDGKVYQIENGRISTGCQGSDERLPCVSELY
ncbi:MAG: hypothetical protein ACEQSD_01060 [Flavobacteriales bacterium]